MLVQNETQAESEARRGLFSNRFAGINVLRKIIFRTLAGLIAAASSLVLIFGDTAAIPFRDLIVMGTAGAMFGIYALGGEELAERFLRIALGGKNSHSKTKMDSVEPAVSDRQ